MRTGRGSRQRSQRLAELDLLLRAERAAGLGDGRREDDQRRHLGDERLGRGDRDLGPGLEEHAPHPPRG